MRGTPPPTSGWGREGAKEYVFKYGLERERRGSRNDPIIMKGKGPRDLLRNSLEWLAYLQFGVSTIDGLHPSVRHSFASGGKMNPPGTAGDYSSIKIELPDERAG